MTNIRMEWQGAVALVQLDNGVTNALSQQLVEELVLALHEIRLRARALVLLGGEKFFSMGLNLPELLPLDRAEMAAFWRCFTALCYDLFTLPIPTISVLQGHAVAGGCVLALTTDLRLATDSGKQFGLNEVQLGLPVPYLTQLTLRQIAGDRASLPMLYQGQLLPFAAAADCGLIDRLSSAEEVLAAALGEASRLAAFAGPAWALIKESRLEAVCQQYLAGEVSKNTLFMECWFDPQVREKLQAAAEKFAPPQK